MKHRSRPSVPPPARLAVLALVAGILGPAAAARPQAAPAPTAAAQESGARAVEARPWEHAASDLPVDPRIHFGRLSNGLRWAWVANSEPKDRSYLRLHVDVGSLAEEDAERGMAHFLEHMAFNGSEHFEPGTLVEWFQRHGMAFGADLNASTDFSQTVYKLDLPDSDAETLTEGLEVLRDFAFGLTLSGEEIDAEKGVIDGEERERDSPGYRVFVRRLQETMGATRLDERIPIGVPETRSAFTADSVRGFYRRWYRPEHMTLVLVGDLGELDPEPLFAEAFGDVEPPAEELLDEPPRGAADDLGFRECFHEPEIPAVSILIERLRRWEDEPYVKERWLEDQPLNVARRMLNLRFSEMLKQADCPFVGAEVGSAEAMQVFDGEQLVVTAVPENWRAALAAAEQELRRALEHGFQEAELAEVRADYLRGLDEAVDRERTRSSGSLVGDLLRAAEARYVPTNAATRRAILKPAIEALTVEQCREALAKSWSEGDLAISTIGNLDLGEDAAKVLDEVLAESRAVEVEKGDEIATGEFAYASDPEQAGAIEERVHVEDLDFTSVRFANGVTLNVKRTDFKEKQILMRATLGEGRLSLASSASELAWMADRVFLAGGLAAHSADDLRRIFAGKQVGLGFGVGTERFELSGATTSEDLRSELDFLCAALRAPGWRDDGYVRVQREIPLVYEGLQHQHEGPIITDFMRAVFSGDPRFSFFDRADLEAVELDQVRTWLTPFLGDAPLEVTLVGDLDVDAAVGLAAQTIGRLPERRAMKPFDENRAAPTPKSGVQQRHAIDTQVPKTLVLIVYPVSDGIDVERRRQLEFLAEVVNDRLRKEVREKLGASYSPGAGVQVSRTHPGVGLLMIQAMTEPAEAESLLEACLAVADSLATDGVTQEEVDRLREPVLKSLRDAKRQNGYWLGALDEAHRRPESLEEIATQAAFIEGVQAEPLTAIAKERLGRASASWALVAPKGAESAGDAAEVEETGAGG